jgi:hypothetical protein
MLIPVPSGREHYPAWGERHPRERDYVASINAATGAGPLAEVQPQSLRLLLDGITADDYLSWARDPEPHALGHEPNSISVTADPLGDRIDLELRWHRDPPDPRSAALAAGFLLTPELVQISECERQAIGDVVGAADELVSQRGS